MDPVLSILGCLWAHADEAPGRLALTGAGQALTYAQMRSRISDLAGRVRADVLGRTVAVAVDDPVARLLCMFALLRRGAAYWVVPDGLPEAVIREHLERLDCPCVLTSDLVEAAFDATRASGAASGSAPDDIAAVYLTSGSTGAPKVIRRSHAQILARVELYARTCGFDRDDRFALVTHPGFVAAEGDIYGALLSGGSLHLLDTQRTGLAAFSGWLRQRRISVVHPPVPLFKRWRASWDEEASFPDLRRILLGGGGVDAHAVRGIFGRLAPDACVVHRYSSTEAGPVAEAVFRPHDELVAGRLPLGVPYPDVEWRVDEGDDGGELRVRSPFVSADAETDGDGFYRTGDVVRHAAGQLWFVGRRDALAKIRGFRVDTEEIATALRSLDGVVDAVVLGLAEDDAELALVAFVSMAQGAATDGPTLASRLSARVSSWAVPSRFVFVDEMPLTPTGKHDVVTLETRWAQAVEGVAQDGAMTPLESDLAALWQTSARNVDAVEVDLPLSHQGGESLVVLAFLDAVEKSLGVRLTPAEFFESESIRKLAALIERGERSTEVEDAFVLRLNRGGFPPLVCPPSTANAFAEHREVASRLDGIFTVFALRPRGLDGDGPPLRTIEEHVDFYAERVGGRLGRVPVSICGYSFGGVLAFALAASGRLDVADLILIDPPFRCRSVPVPGDTLRTRWRRIRRGRRRRARARPLVARCDRAIERGESIPLSDQDPYYRALNRQVFTAFRPDPYLGAVLFVGGRKTDDRLRGWRSVCRGRVQERVFEAPHIELTQPPHVEAVASTIAARAAALSGALR